jgi:hypothetical protein
MTEIFTIGHSNHKWDLETARVSAHHFLPQSGWVSYWIKGEQDIPNVIELFKMRYDSLKPNTKLVTRTI